MKPPTIDRRQLETLATHPATRATARCVAACLARALLSSRPTPSGCCPSAESPRGLRGRLLRRLAA
jgi:hypothetical protein